MKQLQIQFFFKSMYLHMHVCGD